MKNSNMKIINITPEIAIENSNNYAGGLGILEGDKFYELAKIGVDYNVFSILYKNGYVSYEFDLNGNPQPMPQSQPKEFLEKLKKDLEFDIRIANENIGVVAWKFSINKANVIFFETNSNKWNFLNNRVYIENSTEERFYKYVFLAKAIKEYIEKNMEIDKIKYIDMQEAYAAILPLIFRFNNYRFVIHTPGKWGHPDFPKALFKKEFDLDFLNDVVVLTEIGNGAAKKIFCVSRKHFEIVSKMFPHFIDKIEYVTNGINLDRWVDNEIRSHYEKNDLNIDKFLKIKERLKNNLENFISNFKNVDIKDKFIVAWARRIVEYKRPDFILRFIKRNRDLNIIYIIAGKAHPYDTYGLKMMKEFYRISQEKKNVIFIPEYNPEIAKFITQSVDIFLFTPTPGLEASGTSFMKACANGTPVLTSFDGAVPEIVENNKNSWIFGDEKNSSYELFEAKLKEIYKFFFEKREEYNKMCLNAIFSSLPKVDIKNALKKYYPEIFTEQ
ncbi:MAG: glycogen/starch/alpha-glucan phosphorylase [Candidatus Aenigmatarchaeota archaeon]